MTWLTVIAVVNESGWVLDRFMHWYLAQGARQIVLFFDNPDDPALAGVSRLPDVTVIPCTAEFWRGVGMKPDARFTRRQNAALTRAYRQVTQGWVLNVDADELMYFPGTTLAARLAEVPDGVATIRVATAELVVSDRQAPVFRLPISREQVNAIYGDDADLFRPRLGLIGHADGKSFHRAGQTGIRLRQHWAEDAAGNEVTGLRWGKADQAYLLHYFGQAYADWRAKLEWRLGAHGFPESLKSRLRALQQRGGDAETGYRALFDLLHALAPNQLAALRAIGGVLELPAHFPQAAP